MREFPTVGNAMPDSTKRANELYHELMIIRLGYCAHTHQLDLTDAERLRDKKFPSFGSQKLPLAATVNNHLAMLLALA